MAQASSSLLRTERFDLRALYETSRLLGASLDLSFVLDNLLLTAMSKLLVTRGAALLYDPLAGGYRVATVKGMRTLPEGTVLALTPPAEPLQGAGVPEPLATHRIALVLPVAFGHRDIGLLALGGKATGQPFEAAELEFMASLVHMTSSAVHNSLVVEELKQANYDLDHRVQQLNTLFDLSQEFNATIDRKRLVKLLSFALMGQMLVAKHLFLLRKTTDAGSQVFQVVTSTGVAEPMLEPALVERLCSLNKLLLPHEEADAAWEGLQRRGLALVLPIRHQGETCALLCLGAKMTGQPYSDADVEFLYALGNLAFVSIQNSFLVEEQIEKERLEEEMRLARTIQDGLLPRAVPRFPGLDIGTLALPSRKVGGDYFDLIGLEDERLLVAIADVTGKGVPAALLMANLQACLHVMVPMPLSLEEATAHINRVICENTGFDKFITYFHGIYHAADRRFLYVNAGHNPPMLVRADGSLELLDQGGLLLGVMANLPYESAAVTLHPGDTLALFTDGVTEAMSPEEEEYGEERLLACLQANRHRPAAALVDCIYAEIRDFTHNPATLSDDLTLIVLKAL